MQQQFVRARKTKTMHLLGCMHGCKNVPSTTGLCEIKARAPFPHNAMLNEKKRVFLPGAFFSHHYEVALRSTLHCGGMGRGLLFRTNR